MTRYAITEEEARRQAPKLARFHLRSRAHHLGTIAVPDERAAEAFAVRTFGLSEDQRERLKERDRT
jgi:hypothetical protein